MGQIQRRISRTLITILVIIAIVGGIFYIENANKMAPNHKASAQSAAAPLPVSSAAQAGDLPPLAGASRATSIVMKDPTTKASNGTAPLLDSPKNSPSNSLPANAGVNGESPSTLPTNFAPAAAQALSPAKAHSALVDGLAKKDADDLLTARQELNDAIQSGTLATDEAAKAKIALSEISQVVVFGKKIFGQDEFGGSYTVQPGELMKTIAIRNNVTWEFLARINDISDPKRLRAAQTIKIIKGPFFAVVTKKAFTMDLYLGAAPGQAGSMYVMTYPVGLGRDDSTPTGTWLVEPHKKIKNPTYFSPRGEGVIDADDPKNPLGERWVGLIGVNGEALGKQSYGVHGTIEPDSIGKMSSMGCIRMHNEDVEKVFDMLVEGKSTVAIK